MIVSEPLNQYKQKHNIVKKKRVMDITTRIECRQDQSCQLAEPCFTNLKVHKDV
jgi:hypothetical protein